MAFFPPANQHLAPHRQAVGSHVGLAGRAKGAGLLSANGICGAGHHDNGASPMGKASPTKMVPGLAGGQEGARLAAAGGWQCCWGRQPGCRQRSPAGSWASRRTCRDDAVTPSPPGAPNGEGFGMPTPLPLHSFLQDGVHATLQSGPLSWPPPAPWPAGSSPGFCRCRSWWGCSLTWAQHG